MIGKVASGIVPVSPDDSGSRTADTVPVAIPGVAKDPGTCGVRPWKRNYSWAQLMMRVFLPTFWSARTVVAGFGYWSNPQAGNNCKNSSVPGTTFKAAALGPRKDFTTGAGDRSAPLGGGKGAKRLQSGLLSENMES